jgi:general secretion pathway protein C
MENLVKRYFWVVNLVALAVLAYLAARVVNNVVAGEIASIGTTPAAPPSAAATGERGNRPDTVGLAGAITRRNLFNSDPPSEEPFEPDTDTPEPVVDNGEPPGPDDECKESNAPLSLLATMAATPSPLSMAVVDDGQTPQSRVVREGQAVGEVTVARIYRSRLVLSGSNGYECVELGQARKKGKATYTPSSSYSPPPVASNDSSKKIEEGIKKIGKDRFEIDREMLNEQLENMETLTRQARVIPHYRDGKPQGFKIVGVRPGSLLSQLGVRSGDVLKSVGGDEIDSPNKALELLERLKSTNSVVLDVDRRGQPVTLEYQIK